MLKYEHEIYSALRTFGHFFATGCSKMPLQERLLEMSPRDREKYICNKVTKYKSFKEQNKELNYKISRAEKTLATGVKSFNPCYDGTAEERRYLQSEIRSATLIGAGGTGSLGALGRGMTSAKRRATDTYCPTTYVPINYEETKKIISYLKVRKSKLTNNYEKKYKTCSKTVAKTPLEELHLILE